jgi:hypothetical protein
MFMEECLGTKGATGEGGGVGEETIGGESIGEGTMSSIIGGCEEGGSTI